MEIVRLFVNEKANFAKISKNELATTRISSFCPHLTIILQWYLTFNLGDDSFGSSVKGEVVVLKQYHTPLKSIGLLTGNGKGEMLNLGEVIEDIFALHIRESCYKPKLSLNLLSYLLDLG